MDDAIAVPQTARLAIGVKKNDLVLSVSPAVTAKVTTKVHDLNTVYFTCCSVFGEHHWNKVRVLGPHEDCGSTFRGRR